MDLQELEKYRPIPRGGLKLLLASLVPALFAAICLGLSLTDWEDPLVIVLGRVVGIMIIAIVASTLLTRWESVISWPFDYWRRNVKGYLLWCWRDEKGEAQWEPRGVVRLQSTRRDLVIELALGGWFRRSHIICSAVTFREGVDSKRMLSRWRVELVWIHTNTRAIIVRLTDRCGDRVTVSAKDALEILERFSARLEALDNGWSAVVRHCFIVERVLTKERDEVRVNLESVRDELRRADSQVDSWITEAHKRLAVIRETVRQLDETRRFIKSKEARRIREWLAAQLRELDPVGECQGGTQPCVPAQDAGV